MRVKFFISVVIIGLFGVLAFPAPAEARVNGKALALWCGSEKEVQVFSCESYIAGIVDYHTLLKSMGTSPSVDFCIPDKVAMSEMRKVVFDYLILNPRHDQYIAAPAVSMALFLAYPCR